MLHPIELNHPIKPNEKHLFGYLKKVNKNGWYTNFGPLQNELKEKLEDRLGVNNLLLVNNGTSAIQVAAHALKVHKPLTTPFSFAATSSAFHWIGQKTRYSDIDPDTYNLDPALLSGKLEIDFDTIVATHVYGNPCDVKSLETIASAKHVKLIFDAAHAFGIEVENDSVLKYGDASTVSFHATKLFHTVEGGAVVFKSPDHYEYAKELINFGINNVTGQIKSLGTNAKFNEYQAAVGLTNLLTFDRVLKWRKELYELYSELLSGYVKLQRWSHHSSINGAYFPIELSSNNVLCKVREHLNSKNIQSRQYFYPSLNNVYSSNNQENHTPISDSISGCVLCLPLHYYLTRNDVERVCCEVKRALN